MEVEILVTGMAKTQSDVRTASAMALLRTPMIGLCLSFSLL